MIVSFELIIIMFIGLFAGAYGIIVGAGGGFIMVPAFLLILQLPPTIAAGSGLIIVCVNAISGGWAYMIQRRINYQLALFIIVGAIPGSIIGLQLASLIPADSFYKIFGAVLFLLGLFLIFKNRNESSASSVIAFQMTNKKKVSLICVGVLMGIVSTLFGIGGGWLLVPILIYLYKVSPHHATATSVFALSLYALIGGGLHIYQGNIDWTVVLWAGIGTIIGAQLGVYISNKISGKLIIQLLSILLIVIGIKMFF